MNFFFWRILSVYLSALIYLKILAGIARYYLTWSTPILKKSISEIY